MRHLVRIALVALALAECGPAETKSPCAASCEAAAQASLGTANAKYDGCLPAARKACGEKPPSELTACITGAMKSCAKSHSPETAHCRKDFEACYASCGPRASGQIDFWCELDADAPLGSEVKPRKAGLCSSKSGDQAAEAQDRCMKLFMPEDPSIGFSLECSPLP